MNHSSITATFSICSSQEGLPVRTLRLRASDGLLFPYRIGEELPTMRESTGSVNTYVFRLAALSLPRLGYPNSY